MKIRLAMFVGGICLAALARCAPAPGLDARPTITATDSCVLIVLGGSNTGGTATASPTTDVKIPLPGGLGLLGTTTTTEPERGLSCTVSVTNAASPNGGVSVQPLGAPR